MSKPGLGNWSVNKWFTRDVSARVSKTWPKELKMIIESTKSLGGTLATASVCRMLRNAHDWLTVRDSGIPLLVCESDYLDTSTARGRNAFGKMALDAETEAELGSERVRKALAVAKTRGKKLGTHHPRVTGKGAAARKTNALNLARDLIKYTKRKRTAGHGAIKIRDHLNTIAHAVKLNGGKFWLSKVQRILANQAILKLL